MCFHIHLLQLLSVAYKKEQTYSVKVLVDVSYHILRIIAIEECSTQQAKKFRPMTVLKVNFRPFSYKMQLFFEVFVWLDEIFKPVGWSNPYSNNPQDIFNFSMLYVKIRIRFQLQIESLCNQTNINCLHVQSYQPSSRSKLRSFQYTYRKENYENLGKERSKCLFTL